MKLEDQVCSLDLAKKLKELGVKQESQFWWVHSSWVGAEGEPWELGYQGDFPGAGTQEEDYSAFTVAELGEMLPRGAFSVFNISSNRWDCEYQAPTIIRPRIWDKGNTEADARAKMLVYLIEQGLVKP